MNTVTHSVEAAVAGLAALTVEDADAA